MEIDNFYYTSLGCIFTLSPQIFCKDTDCKDTAKTGVINVLKYETGFYLSFWTDFDIQMWRY